MGTGHPRGRGRFCTGAWLFTLAIALCAPAGHSITFADKTFEQLVSEADEIFVGTATSADSRRLGSGAIVTDIDFRDVRMLKGPAGATQATVMIAGGTLAGETLELRGVPRFSIGLSYLLFVQGNGATIFPIVGGPGGMFQVRRDPGTGRERIYDASGKPLFGPPPGSLQAGAQTPLMADDMLQAIRSRLPGR